MFYVLLILIFINFLSWICWQINKPEHFHLGNFSGREARKRKAELKVSILKPVTLIILVINVCLVVNFVVQSVLENLK